MSATTACRPFGTPRTCGGSPAAFESAQAQRLRTGEQIRALVQSARLTEGGRPRARRERHRSAARAHSCRRSRRRPLATLGDTYRRQWNEERDLLRLLSERIARHPAWPWLERVRGIGPSLAARLLARLEIERAPTPSSFWSYCGLATCCRAGLSMLECGYELSLAGGAARSRRASRARLGPTVRRDRSYSRRRRIRAESRSRVRREARTRRTTVRRRSSATSSASRSFVRATRTSATTTSSARDSTSRSRTGSRGGGISLRSG